MASYGEAGTQAVAMPRVDAKHKGYASLADHSQQPSFGALLHTASTSTLTGEAIGTR